MKFSWFLLAGLVACSGNDNPATPDAGPRADAPPTCPLPATPLPAGMHKLYLSFDGVALTLGDCDDSRTNCSSLGTQATTTIPAFLPGAPNRAARITAITAMVQEALAIASVDAVTTRPSSGSYYMVSVGGAPTLATMTTNDLLAAKATCEGINRNSIALVFEQDNETSDRAYANTIAAAFGRTLGMVTSTRNGDCMCSSQTCTHTQACTWGTSAATESGNACDRITQNEQLLLMNTVGCR